MKKAFEGKSFWSAIVYVLFFLIAILAAYFTFRNYDFLVIFSSFESIPFWALLAIFVISLSGSVFRALRWKMLLENKAYKVSLFHVFNALMYGYFVNLGTPRLGEISRAVYLKKKSDIPFSYAIPTIFLERIIDMFFLLACVILSFYFEKNRLMSLFDAYIFPYLHSITLKLQSSFLLISFLTIFGILFCVFIWKIFKKKKNNIHQFFWNLRDGFLSLFYLKNSWLFVVYSIGIWLVYFLTSYAWFLVLDIHNYSPVSLAFICMALGSIAKTLPIQGGGIGVYHFFISQILVLFAVSQETALIYATLNHGFQIFYNLILGFFSLFFYYRKQEF